MIKKLTVLGAMLLVYALTIATPLKAQSNSGWQSKVSNSGVTASVQIITCTEGDFYVLKFENSSTTNNVSVAYTVNVVNDPTFNDVSGTLSLGTNSSQEGDCQSTPFQGLRIPCFDTSAQALSNFNISITVTNN